MSLPASTNRWFKTALRLIAGSGILLSALAQAGTLYSNATDCADNTNVVSYYTPTKLADPCLTVVCSVFEPTCLP